MASIVWVTVVALLQIVGATWRTRSMLPALHPGQPVDLRIDDAGIGVLRTGANWHVTPWSRITTVQHTEAALIFTGVGAETLAVPKDALPDPEAIWAFLDDRLIGKYNLVRPRGPQRLIINSAAR